MSHSKSQAFFKSLIQQNLLKQALKIYIFYRSKNIQYHKKFTITINIKKLICSSYKLELIQYYYKEIKLFAGAKYACTLTKFMIFQKTTV